MPYWHQEIIPRLKKHKEIIISAHGNSLRAIVKHVKQITDDDIIALNLPTGIPYVFEFDEDINLLNDYFLADEATLKALMDEVANQTKK
jgi:2,3-bisphosphoglycerate-dependent phosphoglycerate mutase